MSGIGIGIGIGVGGGFTPNTLPNLIAWYRADKGITLATGVSVWADQSGNGRDLTQATGSKQPSHNATDADYNGQASLAFNSAADQFMSTAAFGSPIAQPIGVFYVGNDDGTATSQIIVGTIDTNYVWIANGSGTYNAYAGTALSSGVLAGSDVKGFAALFNGASSKVYIDSFTPSASGDTGSNTLHGIRVGDAQGAGAPLNGRLAEVIYWTPSNFDAEVKSLLNYAASRYALTINP